MGQIPLPLLGLNRTGLRKSGLFSTHHYLMIWQRWRDGLEVTKKYKYAKNESFVGYGKVYTEAY